MKTCACGKPVRRGQGRWCNACQCRKYRQRSKTPPPPPADPADGIEIVVDEAAVAVAEREKRQAQTDLRKQNTALVDEVTRLRRTLAAVAPLRESSPTVIVPTAHQLGDAVPVLVASDWHVEEEVDAAKVHHLNEYNLDIATKRAHKFFQNGLRLVELAARDSTIKTIHLAALGDFYSGNIHEELMETGLLGPKPAAAFAKDLLSGGIRFWLKNSPFDVVVNCVHGNHGRMTKKPRVATSAENSLESFMYEFLAAEFANEPRVKFNLCAGKMLYVRLFENFVVRFIHGDDISYQGGVGGVTIPILKKIANWDRAVRASVTVMGHFHQRFDGETFVVNGSLIGYNEYAQAIGASPEEPKQSFFLVHARGGGVKSVAAPIWVT